MPKYNNNAGFKGYDNKDSSDKRTKVSPKMIIAIGFSAFIVGIFTPYYGVGIRCMA